MRANLSCLIVALWGTGWLTVGAAVANLQAATLDGAFELVRAAVEREEVPGAIALVARNGQIVRHEAYGLRDIENQLPFTTNTLCWIASITKPITVAAAMTPVAAKKLPWENQSKNTRRDFRE